MAVPIFALFLLYFCLFLLQRYDEPMTPDRDTVLGWLRGGPDGHEKWHTFLSDQPSSTLHRSIAPAQGAIVPQVDLSGADLSGLNLCNVRFWRVWLNEVNFQRAQLDGASFGSAMLRGTDFSHASLRGASLGEVDLMEAKLCGADLTGAFLQRASCFRTDFSAATVRQANLTMASFVDVNFERADISGCSIYGLSAWGLKLAGATQKDLVISHPSEPVVATVDSLEVAQFVHMLLRNDRIRHVIDTITSKVVLVLGRFTPERKAVLDAIREELRGHDYCPVMFDFEPPASRDTQETVTLLAHMARFIIVDLTEPRSVPQELASIVPNLPSVPVQPIVACGDKPWGMFDHFQKYAWVRRPLEYSDASDLAAKLKDAVIELAEDRAKELRTLGGTRCIYPA